MNILKSVLACVAVATFSFTAMAATPKSEAKSDAKTETTTVSKSKDFAHTYYVVSKSGTNYGLSTTPSDQCGLGSAEPCQISTVDSYDSNLMISADDIQNPDETQVESQRPAF